MNTAKEILRNHLNEKFDYSHRIDVEPTPSYPLHEDELNQIFRTMLFRINKKYLRKRYWMKYKPEDKFWIVGCKQGGDGRGGEKHYHLLLHSPDNQKVDVFQDFIMGFIRNAGTNQYNRKRRKIWKNTKDRFHIGNEDLDTKCLINVESVRNQTGSVRYNTRKLNPQLEGDDLFVIGVRE